MKRLIIEELYKKYHNRIFLSAKHMLFGNVVIAEEIANETFLRFNRNIDKFDLEKAKPYTYLFVIKNNLVKDYLRKKKLVTTDFDVINSENDSNISDNAIAMGNTMRSFIGNTQTPVDIINNNDINNKVLNAINDLKPNLKIIANLFFIKEYTYDEIAEELNIPIGTVKTHIFRCRETLQSKLKELKQYC